MTLLLSTKKGAYASMKLDDYQVYYLDHTKLREKVLSILAENNLKASDIAPSIGYTSSVVADYLHCRSNSRFMAGALLERFKLNPKDYMKEGY